MRTNNSVKTLALGLTLALGTLGSNAALAQSNPPSSGTLESAVEGASVKFYITSDLKGNAVARECPTCDPVRLRVTPSMQVIDAEGTGKPIPWDATLNLGTKKADVLYITSSKEIQIVIFYSGK